MDNEPSRVGSGPPVIRRLRQQLRRLPRPQWLRRSRIPLAVVLLAALGVPVLTGSLQQRQRSVDPAALLRQRAVALSASATSSPAQRVGLVTGETVQVMHGPGGRSVISPAPAKPDIRSLGDAAVATFRVGDDMYALPTKALPYIGKKLDPSLFDVSYLQRAGYATGKPLPLSIDWNTGKDHSIPGVKAPDEGSRTSGSIAAAGASAFGAALARDGDAVLAKVKKISLGAPPAVSPMAAANTAPVPAAVPLSANTAPAGSKSYTTTTRSSSDGATRPPPSSGRSAATAPYSTRPPAHAWPTPPTAGPPPPSWWPPHARHAPASSGTSSKPPDTPRPGSAPTARPGCGHELCDVVAELRRPTTGKQPIATETTSNRSAHRDQLER